jgi:hypothetical protein
MLLGMEAREEVEDKMGDRGGVKAVAFTTFLCAFLLFLLFLPLTSV